MDVVSVVGALLSAIGAGISIWQAYRMRRYRDEILRDRDRLALVDAISYARKARDECRKIVTPVGKPVRGVDSQQVINAMRDCLDRLRDHARHPQVAGAMPGIEQHIAEYIRERDERRRYAIADEMYGSLGGMIGTISDEIRRAL